MGNAADKGGVNCGIGKVVTVNTTIENTETPVRDVKRNEALRYVFARIHEEILCSVGSLTDELTVKRNGKLQLNDLVDVMQSDAATVAMEKATEKYNDYTD
jgi:hypothetical protein